MDNNLPCRAAIFDINMGDMVFTAYEQNCLQGIDEYGNDLKVSPHFHSMFEFQYVVDKKITLKTTQNRYTANCDDYIIIPPNHYHWTLYGEEDFDRYVFIFSVNSCGIRSEQFSEFQYYFSILHQIDDIIIKHNSMVSHCVNKIISLERNSQSIHNEDIHRIKILLSMILLSIAEDIDNEKNTSIKTYTTFSKEKLRLQNEINEFVVQCYGSNSYMEDLVKKLNMSQRHINRTVNELFGVSISTMILNQRMNCAWKYIVETMFSMEKIAGMVGYNSYNAFYQAFRKYYGFSPEMLRHNKVLFI